LRIISWLADFRRFLDLRRTIRSRRKLHLEWSHRIQMKVTLREGDHDAVLRKSSGYHLAKITSHLSRVGFDDIHPVPQLEGKGAVAKVGEECLWLGLFLHDTM